MELVTDVRYMEAYHQKCLRWILWTPWYDRVTNDELSQRTGQDTLSQFLSTQCAAVFSHVVRLDKSVRHI